MHMLSVVHVCEYACEGQRSPLCHFSATAFFVVVVFFKAVSLFFVCCCPLLTFALLVLFLFVSRSLSFTWAQGSSWPPVLGSEVHTTIPVFPQEFCGANSILRACKGSTPSLSPSLFLLIEFIQKTNKLPIWLLGEKQQQQNTKSLSSISCHFHAKISD